mgnify:CR=1 FL=1|tara:strand:- start:3780 stop:4517 length:738 start_codon:yes stop_codon:yes gene_type:complete
MFYPTNFKEGIFLKRYKRFFADIEVGGEIITAHCPNTGSLKSCNVPGSPCFYSENNDPKRKLKATLEAIKTPHSWVGLHTHKANKIVGEVILKEHPNYKDYGQIFSEVKISDKSRADFVLSKHDTAKPKLKDLEEQDFHIVEVKNVSLVENRAALFPDAVTTRGQKHIEELLNWIKKGKTAELLFLIQRSDFDYFSAAKDIDPEYAKLLANAKEQGLKIHAYIVDVEPGGYRVREKEAPIKISHP